MHTFWLASARMMAKVNLAVEAWYSSIFLILVALYWPTKHIFQRLRKLPPSPGLSFPILGHLYLLKKPLHRILAKISDQYGPVLLIQFGSRPVLLVSSPVSAEECFSRNDIVFANRPRLAAGKYLGYNYTTLVWASYGDRWRNLRRIASIELLSAHRLQMLAGMRSDEVQSVMRRLLEDSTDGEFKVVDMKSVFFESMLNLLMRMIGGKRYYGDKEAASMEEARAFKEMVTETFLLSGATNLSDFVPFLKWVGLNGTEKRLKALQVKRDNFSQQLIEDRRRMRAAGFGCEPGRKTMIDVLLSLQETEPEYYTDEIIKGFIQVMLSAGTDTTAGTSEWAMSLLLNNPDAMKKARDEIDIHTGKSRLVCESDLANLPYLEGIIKETLRMRPAAPLVPAHESSDDCTVGGFNVPRGTMLLVNVWAIHNDPGTWEEPEKFMPERFLDKDVEKDGSNLKLMPFGYGRRRCPGEGLAIRSVGLILGSLIQCFEWERIDEDLVDMSEGSGLTMPKAQPLVAKCRPLQAMLKHVSTL